MMDQAIDPDSPKISSGKRVNSSPIPLIVASLFVLLGVGATLAGRLPEAVILIYAFVSTSLF